MYHHHCTVVALLAISLSSLVGAAPTVSNVYRRQESGGGQGSSMAIGPQVWIPLVVIGVLFALGVVVACGSRHLRGWTNWGAGAAMAAGVTTGTTPASAREVTADQLAGTNANSNTTNATTNAGTGRARRPRRTRRTPSQISTHSLPAYMKEPGEQEIVIVRGPEDMEDMPIPITVTMPVVDENGRDTPDGSFDHTRPSSEYVPMPESPNDEPLLQNEEHNAQQHLGVALDLSATRGSFDSVMSSEENSQTHYLDDAPPYEAVALDSDSPALASASATTPSAGEGTQQSASAEQQASAGSTRRRSMFMSIFNPRNSRIVTPPVPPLPPNANSPEPWASSHIREGSGPSIVSLAPSEGNPRPRSRIRHRPSHSGSGSMFSLLSRTRSNNNLAADRLTSPSMISLNSISSPLSHTLVRTEFTYPKTGPTPEQLRLISSRESFARFGVPYGPDAIAYASTSRVDLEPPPGFEEVAGTSGAGPASTSSSEERTDSPDSAAQSDESQSNDAAMNAPTQDAHPAVASTESSADEDSTAAAIPSSRNEEAVSSSETSAPAAQSSASTNTTAPSDTSTPPGLALSSSPSASLAPPPSASATSPTTSNAPPSAFKAVFNTGSLPTRAASRASSYMTFATAEESLGASEPPTPGASRYDLNGDDAYESAAETPVNGSAPTTPRLESRHLHESTDTTITHAR
ncbi:hypothetical protein C8Q77DRAFT_737882 [Trametes polyzona]|nr:hypothetical protein C8Q77DRAFT_737882 [Trametes polyzona]